MNVPNSLTIARIFFVPLLVAALVQENVAIRLGGVVITNEWLALAIFLAAAGTDLLDGFLARRWGQITTIGTLLDPIADKLLISAALISLVQVHAAPAWISFLLMSIRHPNLAGPANWMMWGVVVFAIASAVDYFRKFWRKVDERIKKRRRRELLRMERRQRQRERLGALGQSGSKAGFGGTI